VAKADLAGLRFLSRRQILIGGFSVLVGAGRRSRPENTIDVLWADLIRARSAIDNGDRDNALDTAHGLVAQLQGDERSASRRIRLYAKEVVRDAGVYSEQFCSSTPSPTLALADEVNALLIEALSLKIKAVNEPENVEADVARLTKLAEVSPTALARAQGPREHANWLIRMAMNSTTVAQRGRYLDRAEGFLRQAIELAPTRGTASYKTFMRVEILHRLVQRQFFDAEQQINEEYLPLVRKYPSTQRWEELKQWKRNYRLEVFPLPSIRFATFNVIHSIHDIGVHI
jgi:hypothetical protein